MSSVSVSWFRLVVLAAQLVVDFEELLDVRVFGVQRVEGEVRKKFLEEAIGDIDFVLTELLPNHLIIKGSLCLIPCLVFGPEADLGGSCLVKGNGEVAVVNPFFLLLLVRVTGEEKVVYKHAAGGRILRSLIDSETHPADMDVVHSADSAQGGGHRVEGGFVFDRCEISFSLS